LLGVIPMHTNLLINSTTKNYKRKIRGIKMDSDTD